MFEINPIDSLPIWSVYLIVVILLFLAAEVGFRLGGSIQKHWPDQAETGVGTVVGAALALLGFLLAFITGIALENFNARRHLVVLEADVIATTYLRAGYIQSPYNDDSRNLLREYVNIRLDALKPGGLGDAITRSEQTHDKLWHLAEEVVNADPSPTTALYIGCMPSWVSGSPRLLFWGCSWLHY
jgi:hypothetical protein